jgi:hypothetical protein
VPSEFADFDAADDADPRKEFDGELLAMGIRIARELTVSEEGGKTK